jgi:hypothetical protein
LSRSTSLWTYVSFRFELHSFGFAVTFQYAPHHILALTLSLLFSLNLSTPHSTKTTLAPALVAFLFHSTLHSWRKTFRTRFRSPSKQRGKFGLHILFDPAVLSSTSISPCNTYNTQPRSQRTYFHLLSTRGRLRELSRKV